MMSNFKLVDYAQEARPDTKEVPIFSEADIRRTLLAFQKGSPRFVDLISAKGDCLTIGVSSEWGCIMFTSASGDPPYLWALGESGDTKNVVEFDAGGTPTPIPLSRCLPFEEVIEIAVYYFSHEKLPENIQWAQD